MRLKGDAVAQDKLRVMDKAETSEEMSEQTVLETDDQLVPADVLTREELLSLKSSRDFFGLLRKKDFDFKRLRSAVAYEQELRFLQIELVKMQRWV